MPYLKVVSESPAEQAKLKASAYRWQRFSRPIQYKPDKEGNVEQKVMAAEEASDPISFRVEQRAQFVEGVNVYFEPSLVADVFQPWDGRTIEHASAGAVAHEYHIHCDPALVNDFFSMMVCHAEVAPKPDEFGLTYKHLVVDDMKVWKPQDFEKGRMDYPAICNELKHKVKAFRPKTVTMDQFNSAFMLQELQSYADYEGIGCSCYESTATRASNFQMYEALKFSIGNHLVHSYKDKSWRDEQGRSMLQAMLEQVQMENGTITKPRTKELGHMDLCDCLANLCMRCIGDQSDLRQRLVRSSAMQDNELFQHRQTMSQLANKHNASPYRQIANMFGR